MTGNQTFLYENWKQAGSDYAQGVKLLSLYNPDYALLDELKSGKTPMNELYLSAALEEVAASSVTLSDRRAEATDTRVQKTWLDRQLKELYQLRRKTRMRYFDAMGMPSESAAKYRTKIDIELREIRQRVNSLARQRDVWKQTGELPAEPDYDGFVFDFTDLTDAELLKKQRNLRSSVSKAKASVRKAGTKEKTEKYQQKLANLENELRYVTNEIARRG